MVCLYAPSMFVSSTWRATIYITAWALRVARQTIGAMRDALSSETSNRYSTRAFFLCKSRNRIIMKLVGDAASAKSVFVMDELYQQSNNKLHIGSLIKAELERQERTVSWFARKLCCDRSNVYKLFKRSTIDTELLVRVSQILQYDFFEHYKNIL